MQRDLGPGVADRLHQPDLRAFQRDQPAQHHVDQKGRDDQEDRRQDPGGHRAQLLQFAVRKACEICRSRPWRRCRHRGRAAGRARRSPRAVGAAGQRSAISLKAPVHVPKALAAAAGSSRSGRSGGRRASSRRGRWCRRIRATEHPAGDGQFAQLAVQDAAKPAAGHQAVASAKGSFSSTSSGRSAGRAAGRAQQRQVQHRRAIGGQREDRPWPARPSPRCRARRVKAIRPSACATPSIAAISARSARGARVACRRRHRRSGGARNRRRGSSSSERWVPARHDQHHDPAAQHQRDGQRLRPDPAQVAQQLAVERPHQTPRRGDAGRRSPRRG
jgi:hypothetical protein